MFPTTTTPTRVVTVVRAPPTRVGFPLIMHLLLVDAIQNVDLRVLQGDVVLDTRVLPAFTIRAQPWSSTATNSVWFQVNGRTVQKENIEPFALAGDRFGDYYAWSAPAAGAYNITAIPFSRRNGEGISGAPVTIQLTLVG